MGNRAEYWIKAAPRRQAYDQLIDFCVVNATSGGLIDRFGKSGKAREGRERALKLLRPHLSGAEPVSSWPGTETHGSFERWSLVADRGLGEMLKLMAAGLHEWVGPQLPEDLHFYRADGSLLLGSVAHEGMGWMLLSPDEAASPDLGLIELELQR